MTMVLITETKTNKRGEVLTQPVRTSESSNDFVEQIRTTVSSSKRDVIYKSLANKKEFTSSASRLISQD
jgi:hypothetical protein